MSVARSSTLSVMTRTFENDDAQLAGAADADLTRVSRFDCRVEPRGLFPRGRRARLVLLQTHAAGHVPPRLGERREAARGDRLHEDVARDGRLRRPGKNRQPRRVRRRLVEIIVPAASADNLHALNLTIR